MMKNKKQRKIKIGEKGYTLLFAVLVSSLVLAIAISILTISKKEFLLATSARDSASAFYSADAGLECAVYGDLYPRDTFNPTTDKTGNLNCYFSPVPVVSGPPGGAGPFTFNIRVGTGTDDSCAVVIVSKTTDSNGIPRTNMTSTGYNHGWNANNATCTTPSAKRVERAIEYHY